jgi:two-component sensor histidine kinase
VSTTLRSGRRVRSHAPVTAVMKSFARVPGIQDEVDRWCLSSAQSWSLGPAMTVLLKVMDELVSNALEHGVGQVEVDLRLQGGRVWIGVRDEGAGPIRSDDGRFPPHDEAHGLGRVAQTSHVWGVNRHGGHGTTVWSELEIGARGATSDDASSS